MPAATERPLRISIDRGGTFTDCIAKVRGRPDIVLKVLSVDERNYQDAPTEAIRLVLEEFYGQPIPRGTELDLKDVEWIRMGTTVATNALLERNGEKTALLVTRGFQDVLVIGNQSRPYMFDLSIRRPEVLYSDVFEVPERVIPATCFDSELRRLRMQHPRQEAVREVVQATTTGETVLVTEELDQDAVRAHLDRLYRQGYRSVAVCLMHAYIFPRHELQIRDLARQAGFEHISLSHEVSSRSKIVPRGNSAVVDGYLTPSIERYLRTFKAGFPSLDGDRDRDRSSVGGGGGGAGGGGRGGARIEFMQSSGGLVPSSAVSGLHSILSGPAGGVVGYAVTCFDSHTRTPVIGLDMGGTSTDVSRFDGELDHVFETTTAGIPIHVPQLNVNTIAAGGGSVLGWRDGLMTVGPESARSFPGPACYRNGGPLTVTDANLALGRLLPEYFPSVFGPGRDQPLDRDVVLARFQQLTETINHDTGKALSWEDVADGYLQVANQAMCGPIRSLTEARGHEAAAHHLASFGGAGGQHACAVAEMLGIQKVLVHKYSSILSAYGIGLADVVREETRPCNKNVDEAGAAIRAEMDGLAETARAHESMRSFEDGVVEVRRYLSMRYDGSETSIMTSADRDMDEAKAAFVSTHHRQFGFTPAGRAIWVDTVRVRALLSTGAGAAAGAAAPGAVPAEPTPEQTRPVRFASLGWVVDTPVYTLHALQKSPASKVRGPALIVDKTQTIVVGPNSSASFAPERDLLIIDVQPEVLVPKQQPHAPPAPPTSSSSSSSSSSSFSSSSSSSSSSSFSQEIEPVKLSVFRHRFFGIAEQMGRVLQMVSVSANIKERLDFSCAIFTADGHLVANAPHVPAMIGSMAFAVKSQIAEWKGRLRDGDVLLSNSPAYGGVHLPDLTVITPVFASSDIIFWTASRGHHADVGGILPGSMPPTSKHLSEEGAVFDSFLLVRDGRFHEDELQRILCVEPARYPGCSGSRCFQDNVTDIKAQAAANHCGIRLVRKLIDEYTMPVVQLYMGAIQDAAELAIRNLFRSHARLEATDFMDDGTPITLTVLIDPDTGSATFDFTGTGPQVLGNWNAPEAITHSAVLYALRCMVGNDIPLNHGCIKPITLVIPPLSLLSPHRDAAVCAGNVLTSQRLVDVIFKAFGTCAASQGCMNNFTFGIGFGYYETIAGGSGAGPHWNGTSGVHTNMTNTRITDPESLERRYPVLLRRFALRPGTGGRGARPGGDGVAREVEFRVPMTASILSERRRSFAPYGMRGGGDGARGLNTWVRNNGVRVNVGGKGSVRVSAGDRFVVETPGGGAWGALDEDEDGKGQEKMAIGRQDGQGERPFVPLASGSIAARIDLADQV
ncbi:hypothetical protein M406DRAFT_269205 [Cryphonectria parasitica EP155]|uniref:5-oxoprolinase n=1 Tax=Cryphonectria parasitica (strain ATCC 38755 / EP155) TaxID=660469 RepID=A0A9P4XR08_CRYP1|nr:uncharacterized protein M406DRAFT_269205 [Cryphonectria parasitica EP155]KAF3760134.1 hypothetical protein M406DRAFT_269205 [Cryphonectria parasitica EP155]